MSIELLNQIFELCIVPLLAVFTTYIIQYIKVKTNDLNTKTENELIQKYNTLIAETISNCVIATNQTYVETLKTQGKFDAEAQKIAFEKTYNAVLSILTEDAKKYIEETAGDLTTYLTQQIEASVNKTKNK